MDPTEDQARPPAAGQPNEAALAKKRANAAANLRKKLHGYRVARVVLSSIAGAVLTGAIGSAGILLYSYVNANADAASAAAATDGMSLESIGSMLGLVASFTGAAQWASARAGNMDRRIREASAAIRKLTANDAGWQVHWARLKTLEGRA